MSLEIDDIERLLRTRPVTPRAEFVGELERSVLRAASEPDSRRVGALLAGSGLAAALAAVATLLAVTGLLPFTSSGGRARAAQDCRITLVERMERRPYLVRDSEGTVQVRYRVKPMPQLVTRCR